MKPPVKSSLLPASPAVIVAVPAVLPLWKFTFPRPSTWMDAAPALLLSKKFTLPGVTLIVAWSALLVSKKFVTPKLVLVVIVDRRCCFFVEI